MALKRRSLLGMPMAAQGREKAKKGGMHGALYMPGGQ
jgi:hypothetical protein